MEDEDVKGLEVGSLGGDNLEERLLQPSLAGVQASQNATFLHLGHLPSGLNQQLSQLIAGGHTAELCNDKV